MLVSTAKAELVHCSELLKAQAPTGADKDAYAQDALAAMQAGQWTAVKVGGDRSLLEADEPLHHLGQLVANGLNSAALCKLI